MVSNCFEALMWGDYGGSTHMPCYNTYVDVNEVVKSNYSVTSIIVAKSKRNCHGSHTRGNYAYVPTRAALANSGLCNASLDNNKISSAGSQWTCGSHILIKVKRSCSFNRQRLFLLMAGSRPPWSRGRLADGQELLPAAVHGPRVAWDQRRERVGKGAHRAR